MANEEREPEANVADASASTAGTPRWVKVFGVIALVVVVVFVVLLLARGGEHGPGRHSLGAGSEHLRPIPDLRPG